MDLTSYLDRRQALVNRALGEILPQARENPSLIHQAMRYSVLGDGKRIRPILALAACEAVGGKVADALPTACALELIHAYSLVHDDLPAMDNDDFRRGKPSCHKQFGEAIGILTGDALLTLSFELLTQGKHDRGTTHRVVGNGAASNGRSHDPNIHLKVIREIVQAIGTEGMIGGQVVDILQAGKKVHPNIIEYINTRKTGALLSASVRVGALLGGTSPSAYRALSLYGDQIGLTFQLVDDLLDSDGAVRVKGAAPVRQRAERLTQSAIEALKPLGAKAEALKTLATLILNRGS